MLLGLWAGVGMEKGKEIRNFRTKKKKRETERQRESHIRKLGSNMKPTKV